MIKKALLGTSLLVGLGTAPAFAAPDVVVSIAPLHSLTSAVMKDVATPTLLIEGVQSPHSFSLKPSDASKVQNADIIFWISPDLESFLPKSLASLNPNAKSVTMDALIDHADTHEKHDDDKDHDHEHDHKHENKHADEKHDDHKHEPANDTHTHDEHAHNDDDDHHHHHDKDPHIWLNTEHAIEMVEKIEHALVEADPDHAETYKKNAHELEERLESLGKELEKLLTPIKDKPFFVFHDAYGHLQEQYKLNVAGTVSVSPNQTPGAKRIKEIQHSLAEKNVVCVFSEPQFKAKMVQTIIEGTSVKTAELDPLGADIPAGPNHYETMMRALATTINGCLSQ
ncbi:zinc ABC transporter substrate-binding protein [Terasakiella pusilla]|uniref:zinc ABC transporter substrate-binding protein n=1 Tax=Terasakiella pusilla TaxID=64973 RepID=UPI003AA9AFC9